MSSSDQVPGTPDNTEQNYEMLKALVGDNMYALLVLFQWFVRDPTNIQEILVTLGFKHLHDEHIVEVYELCGRDIKRFIYHVQMELPDQLTGKLTTVGPYRERVKNLGKFVARRKHGKPGSYWALRRPPKNRDYKYPLK